ncbi:MAG: hypothetical protein PHW02_04320 [bacterium]|nr:hypothetical protein [bacterium]
MELIGKDKLRSAYKSYVDSAVLNCLFRHYASHFIYLFSLLDFMLIGLNFRNAFFVMYLSLILLSLFILRKSIQNILTLNEEKAESEIRRIAGIYFKEHPFQVTSLYRKGKYSELFYKIFHDVTVRTDIDLMAKQSAIYTPIRVFLYTCFFIRHEPFYDKIFSYLNFFEIVEKYKVKEKELILEIQKTKIIN